MALIPPPFLNAVVSIGLKGKDENNEPIFKSVATGFLIGKSVGEEDKKGQKPYLVCLVTNRHVFYDEKRDQYVKEVFFRLNTTDDSSREFKVPLLKADGTPIWFKHNNRDIDLAVLPINPSEMTAAKVDYYFFKEGEVFLAKDFFSKNISTGDSLFVLGFPMSISGKSKNFVIVRHGIIARVDEEVLENGFYYIDASAYPGNSGGPVIKKPEIVSITGTKGNNKAGLIGVVSSGVTYRDVAISQQTGEAKVVFTEQTGLVKVVPVEYIYEVIDDILAAHAPEAEVEESEEDIVE